MEVVKTSIWKLVKDCQLKRPHLKYNQKCNICSHALTSRFVFCFSVFSLRLLHHHPTFDPPPLKFHYNLSCSAFSTAPPVIFEVYETSAHVRVCVFLHCVSCFCGSETGRRSTDCFPPISAKPIICGKTSAASCHSISPSPWQPLAK